MGQKVCTSKSWEPATCQMLPRLARLTSPCSMLGKGRISVTMTCSETGALSTHVHQIRVALSLPF